MTAPEAGPWDLVAEGVTAGYGDIVVLRDVCLHVPAGHFVALLGSNGAGKSTFLRTVMGTTSGRGGRITFGGETVGGRAVHDLTRLGICFVPEGRAIYRSLSVQENLQMYAGGVARTGQLDRVYEIFPRLKERRRQVAGSMSGGEQQMLALSRAFLREPLRLLMIDEPSMGLAPIVVEELFGVLDRFRSEETSVLLVEQYAQKALAMADLVYVLNRGRVVFAGEPHELTARPDVFALYVDGPHEEAGPPNSTVSTGGRDAW